MSTRLNGNRPALYVMRWKNRVWQSGSSRIGVRWGKIFLARRTISPSEIDDLHPNLRHFGDRWP